MNIFLHWIHVLCTVVFIGTMIFATFFLMPILKKELAYETRQALLLKLIPKIRRVMRIIIITLILSGISMALYLHLTHPGPADSQRIILFVIKMIFAGIPLAIFALAPRILGAKSKENLCCDPDAKGQVFGNTATKTSAILHLMAISSGIITIFLGVTLTNL